jgi:PKD repeat protein
LATWTDLPFTIASAQDTWTSSGDISLASINGANVHIAFQYLSNGNPRRWGVDEILITAGSAGPSITVTSPMTGDIWEQGTTHDITWTASDTGPNVMIELTSDASSGNPAWTTLVASVPAANGTWTWNIPSGQTLSNDCQIRISDLTFRTSGLSGIFSVIEPIVIPQLIITEIMYNPPESGSDSLEFIEIFNNDDVAVDLTGYYFSEGVTFTFPSVTLNQGDYFLVAVDSVAFQNFFGMMAYEWASGGLSNSGERITLSNNYGMIVDSVYYLDVAPWPDSPDGDGPSLTFCDPGADNGLGENWSAAIELVGLNSEGDSVWANPGAGCSSWPVAEFSADNTIVMSGGSVNFTDESTGDPTTWVWTFIGGNPGSYVGQTPPPIVYSAAGDYTVVLVITNAAGSSTEEKADYIHVGDAPVADFSASPLSLYAGETVDFTDLSTGNPETWAWEFEGGSPAISGQQNPQDILYATAGLYSVTLTVTNMFGTDMITKEEYIDVMPVGIDERSGKLAGLYPNPNNGSFNILNNTDDVLTVNVYSVLGQLAGSFMLETGVSEQIMQGASEGIYFVTYSDQNGKLMKTEKMIIR